MPTKKISFEHGVIDDNPAGSENDVTLIADVNGNGLNDIIIGGKYGPGDGRPVADGNLVWYEAPHWNRHVIGFGKLEAGGVTMDLTGNGRLDLVIGEQYDGKCLYWWENPADPKQRWTRRLITDSFQKYHDQAVGDVDGDGVDELVVISQVARTLLYYDIPEDPTVEPWPESCRNIIATDVELEGLRVVDIDGDGVNEIVAGANYFKREGNTWRQVALIEPFAAARAEVADLNGNGHLDIVLAEGESYPGRLLWCEGPEFTKVHVLHESLCHPHSLEVADFNQSGSLDIFTGEMHLNKNPAPKLYIYLNDGDGNFEPMEIDCPQGTHEAKVGDIDASGRPSIVGKPYMPHCQIDIWMNVTEWQDAFTPKVRETQQWLQTSGWAFRATVSEPSQHWAT